MAEFTRLEITPAELAFYARAGLKFGEQTFPIPAPKLPPNKRTQQRCSFRNQRRLYKRSCDLTGKSHVTLYRPGSAYRVYSIDAFWSDGWDAVEYGRPYDPDRPFLEQLAELYKSVPRLGMMNRQCENSEYCNYSYSNKNCYLVFSSHYEENCYHGNCSARDIYCADYHWIAHCELCYECFFSSRCYHSIHLDHCTDCDECWFCLDCHSCKHCLFSANLRHKEYCIFNQQLTKSEYFSRLEQYRLHSHSGLTAARTIFNSEVRKNFPVRAVHQLRCENCEGTDHSGSRNLQGCFQADTSEDTLYSTYLGQTYDCVDVNYMGFDRCELSHQCIGCTNLFHGLSCDSCWQCSEMILCSYCFSSENCFGCMSLKRKSHCILNKQYSPQEYERTCSRIVESLIRDGVWGQFFPPALSAFGYNETVAQDWYPLTQAQASAEGYNWTELDIAPDGSASSTLPDSIHDLADNSGPLIIRCEATGQPFKILPGELNLLKKIGVPIPRLCPDERQRQRLKQHSPWQLWNRQCAKTGAAIRTAISPDRPETVYSVEAYLKEFG